MKGFKIAEEHLILKVTVLAILLSLLTTLCSCTGENNTPEEKNFDENGLFVSEAMSYDALKSYYSENKGVSLNDAEGKLAQMEITREKGETYRVVTQKIEGSEKKAPYIEVYLKTAETEDGWTAESIRKVILLFDAKQEDGIFLGDLVCWLRENNQLEYSLNGNLYKTAAVKEGVVCKEEIDGEAIQLHYLPEGKVRNKDSEYLYIHKTIIMGPGIS